LTSRQLTIWSLRRDGLPQFKIAQKLGVTRQAIHNVIGLINSKVSNALTDAAKANKIRIRHMDPIKGILVGYSPEVKDHVIITFSVRNGIQVWYHHTGQCADCEVVDGCRKMLLEEADERSINLSEEDQYEPPAKLADKIFSKVITELKP
jgi:DNA-binding XRE family transcriptional regulator